MAERMDLHRDLVSFASEFGIPSEHVYFQPPESIRLEYPCIIYKRNSGEIRYADNDPYNHTISYEVTIIDKNPDSRIVAAMFTRFKMNRYNRHFVVDNLNHDVFTLFY